MLFFIKQKQQQQQQRRRITHASHNQVSFITFLHSGVRDGDDHGYEKQEKPAI
jgi:hypothetical protein